jgi:hypothetical protein
VHPASERAQPDVRHRVANRIDERITDALEAPKPEGVDLDVVDRAAAALEAGDLPRTRELLQTSIGAGPVVGGEQPQPIRETSGQPGQPAFAVGAETGTAIVLDVFDPRTRFDAGEIVLLVLSLTAIGLGVWLAWRFRPPEPEHANNLAWSLGGLTAVSACRGH